MCHDYLEEFLYGFLSRETKWPFGGNKMHIYWVIPTEDITNVSIFDVWSCETISCCNISFCAFKLPGSIYLWSILDSKESNDRQCQSHEINIVFINTMLSFVWKSKLIHFILFHQPIWQKYLLVQVFNYGVWKNSFMY